MDELKGSKGSVVTLFMSLSLMFLILTPLMDGPPKVKELSGIIHVGSDYPIRSIQLAIDLATEGSTIVVHGGDYYESLSISKGLTLTSAPGETSRLIGCEKTRGRGLVHDTMMIVASNSKVTVKDMEFNVLADTWDDAAIKVQDGIGHEIYNNTIYGGKQGIWVHGGDAFVSLPVDDIWVHGNTIFNVSGHGIYMQRTYGMVEKNRINQCGDGIMVAFGWTAMNEYANAGISGNVIENCSVGLNFVDSTVFNYYDNIVRNCTEGELMNSSDQFSQENDFVDCVVGTRIMNGSSPLLRDNTYDGCATPVQIEKCRGARLYENLMTGSNIGIDATWEDIEQLNHTIATNNTLYGRPIYYSFGDHGVQRTMNGYGQIFIANTTHSKYKITDPSPSLVTLISPQEVDISSSRISSGLKVIGPGQVTGSGVALTGSAAWMLSASSSTMSFYNSTISNSVGTSMVLEVSAIDVFNGTITGDIEFLDTNSRVRELNLIGLDVRFEDGVEPVEGAEFGIEKDGSTFRSTPLFEGSAPPTDEDGKAGPFWLLDRTTTSSNTLDHETDLTVNVTRDLSWEETRPVDTSSSHDEVFITADIRAPSAPRNLRTTVVDDGIGLEWDWNTDDTALYRVYRMDGTLWTFLIETDDDSYTDASAPNGTSATYRVTAVDDVWLESLPSNEVVGESVDNLPPLPPTSLMLGPDGVTLSWKRSPSPDVVLYEVYIVETGEGGPITPKGLVGSTAETTFVLSDLSDDDKYVSVRAVDDAVKRSVFCDPVDLTKMDLTWPKISEVEWTYGAKVAWIGFKTDVPTNGNLFFGTSPTDLQPQGLDDLSTEHLFEVVDLAPQTTYYFYAFAIEPSGNSITDDNNGVYYTFTTFASESFLKVTLRDEDGEPVTRATVTAEGPNGTLSVMETEPGTYTAFLTVGIWTVEVMSTDHLAVAPVQFYIGPGEWKNLTFELISIGWDRANLTITVLDEDGVPIEGASVEANGIVEKSGVDGKAVLGPLDTNRTYRIKVTAAGYRSVEQDIYVGPKNKEQSETVHLEKAEKESSSMLCWLLVIIAIVLVLLMLMMAILIAIGSKARKKSKDKGKVEKAKEEKGPEEDEVRTGTLPSASKGGKSEAPPKKKAGKGEGKEGKKGEEKADERKEGSNGKGGAGKENEGVPKKKNDKKEETMGKDEPPSKKSKKE